MGRGDRGSAIRQIDALYRLGPLAGLGDGDLLGRFLDRHGEAAELAFEAIVGRHGGMVLRVCRRVLRDEADAEDAFQATFLALARGASSVRRRDSLASWLHGAALRVSACARATRDRRRRHEGRWAEGRDGSRDGATGSWDDLGAVVHEEVGRLPEGFRAAVVLCDLEGVSLAEAARRLGLPVGTVKSRVSRGRERLRDRLTRRGLAPTVGVALAREVAGAVSPARAGAVARAVMGFVSGGGAAGALSSPAVRLFDLFRRSLIMGRLKATAGALISVGVLGAGATLLAQARPGADGPSPASAAPEARGGLRVAPVAALARPPADQPAATGAQQDQGGTYVKTYGVSDLVPRPANHGLVSREGGPRVVIPEVQMEPLVELLATSVASGTWTDRDALGRYSPGLKGVGTIIPFHLSLSLIVRHTPVAHEQFAARLEQLRRVVGSLGTASSPVAEVRTTATPTSEQGYIKRLTGLPPAGSPLSPFESNKANPIATTLAPPPPTQPRLTEPADAVATVVVPPAGMPPPAQPRPSRAPLSVPTIAGPPPASAPPAQSPAGLALPSPPVEPTHADPAPALADPLTLPPPPDEVEPGIAPSPPPAQREAVPSPTALPPPRPASVPLLPPTVAPTPARAPRAGAGGRTLDQRIESLERLSTKVDGIPSAAETDRRFRSLEEKLDRVLKALDVPKSDGRDPAPSPKPSRGPARK